VLCPDPEFCVIFYSKWAIFVQKVVCVQTTGKADVAQCPLNTPLVLTTPTLVAGTTINIGRGCVCVCVRTTTFERNVSIVDSLVSMLHGSP